MGRARKRVDIVIFEEGKKHKQENIYTIVEVKSENIKPSDKKEGIEQLESYVAACINTQFALWVGSERLAFKVVEEKGKRKLKEITDIPKRGETTIPKPTRGSLVPAVNLNKYLRESTTISMLIKAFKKTKHLRSY